jgi:hypothetical protein
MIGTSLAGGLSACAYEGEDGPQPTVARTSPRPAPTLPARAPDVLAVEKRNYADLEQRLSGASGPELLSDSGPADGPGVGFSKAATVDAAGPYTVTAACVGISRAQISLFQETVGGSEHQRIDVDCAQTRTQTVQLRQGYVGAQLTRRADPAGAWTGAVAGIRITGG